MEGQLAEGLAGAALEVGVLMLEQVLALVALAHMGRQQTGKGHMAKGLRIVLVGVRPALAVAFLLEGQTGSSQERGHSGSMAALTLAEGCMARHRGA